VAKVTKVTIFERRKKKDLMRKRRTRTYIKKKTPSTNDSTGRCIVTLAISTGSTEEEKNLSVHHVDLPEVDWGR
jgi:hypothetical protein